MHTDLSFLAFFMQASGVVKAVMLLLLSASIISWALIIQRSRFLRATRRSFSQFEDQFWSDIDLATLYRQYNQSKLPCFGLAQVFCAGFAEYKRLLRSPVTQHQPEMILAGTQRAMRVAAAREYEALEKHLGFLATVASVSPYVGLFGTVWGIMAAFHALGAVQQATIAMVAPGISEALIATAMGLFAAIPAVVAYNRYQQAVQRLNNQLENFQDELAGILLSQVEDHA